MQQTTNPANIYLFKFNNRNSRSRCEICSYFTYFTPFSSGSIVDFEQVIFSWEALKSKGILTSNELKRVST